MYCFYIASFRYLQGYQVAILTIPTPLFVVLIDAFLEGRMSRRAIYAALIALAVESRGGCRRGLTGSCAPGASV